MSGMRERRCEVRMMCADMLEVSWALGGRIKRATGLLEDISTAGACLQMEGPVPLGTVVKWQAQHQDFTGIVRYCVYREIGYFIGVEFACGTRWSKKVYQPPHLLTF